MKAHPQAFGTGLVSLDVAVADDGSVPRRVAAGGTCGNVLTILAFLGWSSHPVSRLNGDAAGVQVRSDLARWDVALTYASQTPAASTPMLVQRVGAAEEGPPQHRFSWKCPTCGAWLPSYRPVTLAAVEQVMSHVRDAELFFLDRLSPAGVALATESGSGGGLVVFEPSSNVDDRLLSRILGVAHVLKYSADRFDGIDGVLESPSLRLEVQTLGSSGLRYRHRFTGHWTDWRHLGAVRAPVVIDTCGSGDWCTAGLLNEVGRAGLDGFLAGGASQVREGLRTGQAMAAWNCGFLGARGGMYERSRSAFRSDLSAIRSGQMLGRRQRSAPEAEAPIPTCPACAGQRR